MDWVSWSEFLTGNGSRFPSLFKPKDGCHIVFAFHKVHVKHVFFLLFSAAQEISVREHWWIFCTLSCKCSVSFFDPKAVLIDSQTMGGTKTWKQADRCSDSDVHQMLHAGHKILNNEFSSIAQLAVNTMGDRLYMQLVFFYRYLIWFYGRKIIFC